MYGRLCNCLRHSVRHPKCACALALILGLAAYLGWQGCGALWFRHERAAALQALADYDCAEARRRLGRCLELRPNDAAMRLLAAQAARRDEDLIAAQDYLDSCRDLTGATPEVILELALLKAQRGQVSAVVDYLISRLEIRSPASEQILEALTRGSFEIYLLDKAGFWAYELLEKFPKNPVGLLMRARLTDAMGDRDQALERFRQLVQEYPRHTKGRLHLTELLFRTKAYDEAAANYEELRRQQPGAAAAVLGLARCQMQRGRPEEVRRLLGQLEAEHGDRADVLLECGRFALSENRFADAERFLRRAVELAPHEHDAHYRLGVCLQQLDQAEESRRHLQRSEEILAGMNELEKVVEAIGKAPADPALRLQAGRICLRMGQKSEGLRWLHGVLAIAPHDAGAQAALRELDAARSVENQRQQDR